MKYLIFVPIFLLILLVSFFTINFGKYPVLEVGKTNSQILLGQAKESEINILIGGDVMLGRTVQNSTVKSGGYGYPFVNISELLRSFDLVFVNLENPIVPNCPWHYEGYKFCSLPKSVESLVYAGVDVVSIANNHTYNYGKDGVETTKKYLDTAGVAYTGDGNLVVKDFYNTRIGFVGFDFTSKTPKESDYELVSDSKEKVDILMVAVHWGNEYKAKPEKLVTEWGREIVRRGADIIAGAHPHWVQGVDCKKNEDWDYIDRNNLKTDLPHLDCDNLIVYSMGNLVFDQMWSEETKKGLLLGLSVKKGKFQIEDVYTTYIEKNGQPVLLND